MTYPDNAIRRFWFSDDHKNMKNMFLVINNQNIASTGLQMLTNHEIDLQDLRSELPSACFHFYHSHQQDIQYQ